jgi:hypothetical protein
MTTKLNDNHRRLIRNRLLAGKLAKREADLKQYKAGLALKIYDTSYSGTQRLHMESLPEGWLKTVKIIKARLGGIDFGSELPDGMTVRVPASGYGYQNESSFLLSELHGPLAEEAVKLDQEGKSIVADKERLTHEINSVLHSVTTANRLVTVWPEIKEIVDEVCRTYAVNANLPAPCVTNLNRDLGLVAVA